MKKNKIIVLILISSIVIFLYIAFEIKNNKNNSNSKKFEMNNNEMLENEISINEVLYDTSKSSKSSNELKEEKNKIESIKNEISSKANSEIYTIEEEEPGGRQILQIKPSVQLEVDLASIIKNGKPKEEEVKELLGKMPKKYGVWLSEISRDKFKELLDSNNISNIKIKDDGYLMINGKSENSIAIKLKKMINSSKLYIINIKGICYERDYISGEIIEYPFEDMDPTQIVEPFESSNISILEVTSNKNNLLTNKEILEEIIIVE